jgi:oxygen-independent coproporphyrinogen-3 oxidase
LEDYLAAAEGGAPFRAQTHVNSLADRISEYMFLGLRKTEGVSEADYAREFGEDVRARFGREIDCLIGEGLLEHNGNVLRLTPQGIDVSNKVFVAFV